MSGSGTCASRSRINTAPGEFHRRGRRAFPSALWWLRRQQRARNASNLTWKLAARLDGWAGNGLLDSYDLERRPVFKQVGDEFITARIKWEGEVINRHDPRRDPEAFARDWVD